MTLVLVITMISYHD